VSGSAKYSFSQEKSIEVEGRIYAENDTTKGFFAKLIDEAGQGFRIMADTEGNYTIKLKYNKDYKIEFGKKGYYSQLYAISTVVTKDRISDGLHPFLIDVELFKSTEGFAPELLKLPLQRISYNEDDNDFVTCPRSLI